MEYQLGWRDELGAPLDVPLPQTRLHANLCLLACESLGGDPDRALPSAGAVEVAYQFAQVHADVEEGSQLRHDRSTVWWLWGPAQAINTGDGLHALARLSLMHQDRDDVTAEDVLLTLRTLDGACLRMCEGIFHEIQHQERAEVQPEAYLRMSRDKVGALLGCALEMGAIMAGATEATRVAYRQCGEEFGMALQVQEDIQSIWGEPLSGKSHGIDLLNKKKGFPVVVAMAEALPGQKRELGTLFFKRVLEPPDVELVKTMLDGLNARERAQNEARQLFDQAIARLEGNGTSDAGLDDLRRVARWLALRE
jgi:geranylgeranyl diphosphate synthase type I